MRESRVFFALWPDTATASAIEKTIDTLQPTGRRVARRRLHLTLAFIGPASAQRIEQLCERAADIRVPAFTLQLDRVGYFSRPRVLWLGASGVPSPLVTLAQAVRDPDDAQDCNQAFRPHITLTRGADPLYDPARIAPIDWPVARFSLVQSGAGGAPGAYRQLGQWRLV